MKGRDDLDEVLKLYKSGHKVVTAHPRHIDYIAENMRKEDIKEVSCFSGTPRDALVNALAQDDATMTVLCPNDIPYAMFGAGSFNGESYIWMLGTNDIVKHKFEFLKRCREWVWGLVGIYEKVYNYVHEDNELAIKWLSWCGAEFIQQVKINGETFYRFMITKDSNV